MRASEREKARHLQGEARKRQQAREQYFRDQVAMLQESIKEVEKDEAVAMKAKIEASVCESLSCRRQRYSHAILPSLTFPRP